MKYKNAIKKYFDKRRRKIDYYLDLNPKNYKPETFHKLRTEIKRVNAVFDLLNESVSRFQKTKTFELFKKIFKSAGAVRDLQVKERLLAKYRISLHKNGLDQDLQKELHESKIKFWKQITRKLVRKVKKNLDDSEAMVVKLKRRDVDHYFKREEEKIKKLLVGKLEADNLHELRRRLKIFFYNLKAVGWNHHSISYDKIDHVQELLGKWHDEVIAEQYIEEQKKTSGISRQQQKAIDRVRIKIHGDIKILVKQIRSKNKELAASIRLHN